MSSFSHIGRKRPMIKNSIARVRFSCDKLVTRGLHALFFGQAQVTPKPQWESELTALGHSESLKISRKNRIIAALRLSLTDTDVKGPAVILCHPLKKRAKSYFSEGIRLKHYLESGFHCYLFDFNGFGDSEDSDLFFWKDVVAVIENVKSLNPGKPIIRPIS